MLKQNQFVRSNGLGNDYLVMDPSVLTFPLTPDNAIKICDRHRGIGSDGILVLEKPDASSQAESRLRIINPDGSEAEKSGNGLRIYCKFLFEHGYTEKTFFEVDTAGGKVQAQLHLVLGKAPMVTVDMGKATFDSKKIPVLNFEGEVVQKELLVSNGKEEKKLTVTCVSVGNPHCVVFLKNLSDLDIQVWGTYLENHSFFPRRSNVQFAQVLNEKEVAIHIWERGAGYTLASGSSSCAVAAACVKTKQTGNDLTLKMPGGSLNIQVKDDFNLTMRGPVEEVCVGEVTGELLALLEKK